MSTHQAAPKTNGRLFVVIFLAICLVLAAFSVFVTLSAQWFPPPEQEPPPIEGSAPAVP